MIEYKSGNILAKDAEYTEALVNTVNCIGIMGRGIALQFKKFFPENFKAYADACEQEEVSPGRMFVHLTEREHPTGQLPLIEEQRPDPKYIINFPTKKHWRGGSRMDYIESGLVDLVKVIKENKIRSIAIPSLGCGLGGLDWKEVKPRIASALGALENVRVIVYEPVDVPDEKSMAHELS